ncbi:tetratricopeptide repeat protein [Myxococcota bacterium]|nr:tetratricopeptide repeat protein [Myxococcota bacterium]MBU1432422.1 tetratricopeptide repeat protein [Myxococcota bacterium]MBU1898642.1 tetratricopeptide repeat protein [Myxococcota bacterium]
MRSLILLAALLGLAHARKPKEIPPPPPYLLDARQALVKGELEHAAETLTRARACWRMHEEACGFTRAQYDAVVGIFYLERGELEASVAALQRAIEAQPSLLMASFYLGQALYKLERWAPAAEALERSRPIAEGHLDWHALLARAHRKAKQPEAARQALERGLARFEEHPSLLRELAGLFIEQGLFAAALEIGRRWAAVSPEAYAHLQVAEAHRRAGLRRAARLALEEAVLLNPGHVEARVRLGYLYAESEMPLSAARLFSQTPKAYEAAEQYHQAARPSAAWRLNARVEEATRRQAQGAQLHLGTEAFFAALARLEPLEARGQLDGVARLRMAWAAIQAGRFSLARRLLEALERTSLRGAAVRLRGAIEACQKAPWGC